MYQFKYLNTGKITPTYLFTNDYAEELYELEHVYTDTKRLRIILDAKYEKVDLHKVIETQCQHLTVPQCSEFLKWLQKFEEFFDGTIGTHGWLVTKFLVNT